MSLEEIIDFLQVELRKETRFNEVDCAVIVMRGKIGSTPGMTMMVAIGEGGEQNELTKEIKKWMAEKSTEIMSDSRWNTN